MNRGPRRMIGIHHFETSTTASWKRSLDRKRPLGYHSNSHSWKGKERTPPFGQTARVCTGKQTNLGFSEGILPRQLEFSFFDGEVNVNFEWSTFCALGRRTTAHFCSDGHKLSDFSARWLWLIPISPTRPRAAKEQGVVLDLAPADRVARMSEL